MEELKNIWKEENVKLEQKLELNTNLLNKMNMNKVVSEFDKVVQLSIMGRNVALVYGGISLIMAVLLLDMLAFSIPAFLGAILMFWSFWSHLSLRRPEYDKLSMLDLQKTISKFKIHTAAYAKYDMAIVGIWLLTLIPAFVMYFQDFSIYSNTKSIVAFGIIGICVTVYIILASKRMFQKFEHSIKLAEDYLGEIREFELK